MNMDKNVDDDNVEIIKEQNKPANCDGGGGGGGGELRA